MKDDTPFIIKVIIVLLGVVLVGGLIAIAVFTYKHRDSSIAPIPKDCIIICKDGVCDTISFFPDSVNYFINPDNMDGGDTVQTIAIDTIPIN